MVELKWLGALIIFAGCGGLGICMAAALRREERELQFLLEALDLIRSELEFHLSPLPELCRTVRSSMDGRVAEVFSRLETELDSQISTDASVCMAAALSGLDLPKSVYHLLRELGRSLGRFDLSGQLRGMEGVRAQVLQKLEVISSNRESRTRSYQTLALCAGAAIAILLL